MDISVTNIIHAQDHQVLKKFLLNIPFVFLDERRWIYIEGEFSYSLSLQIQDPLQFGRPPQIIGRSSLKCKKVDKFFFWSFSLFVKVMLCINSTLNIDWCFRYQFSFDVRCQSPLNLIDSLFTSTLPQCQMNSEIFAIFVSLNIFSIWQIFSPLPYL